MEAKVAIAFKFRFVEELFARGIVRERRIGQREVHHVDGLVTGQCRLQQKNRSIRRVLTIDDAVANRADGAMRIAVALSGFCDVERSEKLIVRRQALQLIPDSSLRSE